MNGQSPQCGVLLMNLGTPDSPTTPAVKRYLRQFLSDQRVVDVAKPIWQVILNGFILPFRSPKVAHAYQGIWDEYQDSPLRAISQQQARELQSRLAAHYGLELPVSLAMTYGSPSVQQGIDQLLAQGVSQILVLPLYPQYSATTTAAAFDAVYRHCQQLRVLPELRFINHYCFEPSYIDALAGSIQRYWQQHGQAQRLMFSFHGIPKRYADLGDPYPQHCQHTAQAVADKLQLQPEQWLLCYQSRFGREEWLKPYTDHTLAALPEQGITSVDLVCPAFSADCLETLEEIAVENAEVFTDAGGQQYRYIPALNASPCHISMMAELVVKHSQGWLYR